MNKTHQASVNLSISSSVKEDLVFLWSLESLGIEKKSIKFYDTEFEFINEFEQNVKFVNNSYETGLLWKFEKSMVAINFQIAKSCFEELKRKVVRNNDLCNSYKSIVYEQENLGIVEDFPNKIVDNSYFMPIDRF